jgi:glutaredoxin 3
MKITKNTKALATACIGTLATTSTTVAHGFTAIVAPTSSSRGLVVSSGGGAQQLPSRVSSLSFSSSSSTSLNMAKSGASSPATDFAKKEIANNKVVVFSKSYCPFCTATKNLLNELKVDYTLHELNEMGQMGSDIQAALQDMTGQRTVPNVFVNGQHLGGNDVTQAAAKSGKLQKMLLATTTK